MCYSNSAATKGSPPETFGPRVGFLVPRKDEDEMDKEIEYSEDMEWFISCIYYNLIPVFNRLQPQVVTGSANSWVERRSSTIHKDKLPPDKQVRRDYLYIEGQVLALVLERAIKRQIGDKPTLVKANTFYDWISKFQICVLGDLPVYCNIFETDLEMTVSVGVGYNLQKG